MSVEVTVEVLATAHTPECVRAVAEEARSAFVSNPRYGEQVVAMMPGATPAEMLCANSAVSYKAGVTALERFILDEMQDLTFSPPEGRFNNEAEFFAWEAGAYAGMIRMLERFASMSGVQGKAPEQHSVG